ncbi:tRNA lysidine(34) synthetase TilS [Malonomonas rubra]|nr:tRNA lysidine(34) synthetase TilS [Malonomonas rubra]
MGSADHLLVAVSGGIDSVVLLRLLSVASNQFGFRLSVAHFDHQIRPESRAEAEFVEQLCERMRLSFFFGSGDVPAFAKEEKISLEMAARQLRRVFLLRTAKRLDARLIALAHHRDDQVETFFLRLLRGSGSAGLAAMKTLNSCWWRPLLGCSREQILDFARKENLNWVEDGSNADTSILRNRVRHEVLPQLRELNPQLDERLSVLSAQFQADEDFWQQHVAKTITALIVDHSDGLRLDRQKLLGLHAALRVRVVREALRQVRGDLQRIEAVHLQSILSLLTAHRSQSQLDIPDCWVARRYQFLWLRKKAPEKVAAYAFELPVPGRVDLPDGRFLRAVFTEKKAGESAFSVEFDAVRVKFPLLVRNWQFGDVFHPQGMPGKKKLKRLFSDEKIELEERDRVPLIVSGEEILWVAGMRRSQQAPVSADSAQILRLELLEGD